MSMDASDLNALERDLGYRKQETDVVEDGNDLASGKRQEIGRISSEVEHPARVAEQGLPLLRRSGVVGGSSPSCAVQPDVPRPVSVQRAQDRAGPALGDRRLLMIHGHEEPYVYIGAGTWMLARACGKIPRKETK